MTTCLARPICVLHDLQQTWTGSRSRIAGSDISNSIPSTLDPSSSLQVRWHPRPRSPAGRVVHLRQRRSWASDTTDLSSSTSNTRPVDPLLYDRLVRRFQSASEREAEGRKKGYSGILEADLARSEAKLDALRNPSHRDLLTYSRDTDGRITSEEKDEVPYDKEDGLARWKDIMAQRFLGGHDTDFDYGVVDENGEYDDTKTEERDAQDEYFDCETPEFVREEAGCVRELRGETGVQDF